tara:strand:- start:1632 stop:2480 length:849 start_codon:yes stop_codon:yes gene_type:complete
MNVLLAVVDDLLMFIRESLFGSVALLPTKQKRKELPTPDVVDVFTDTLQEYAQSTPSPDAVVYSPALLHTGEQYYIGSIDAYVYADPVIAFDNALQLLSYGTSVRLLQLQGRWAQVRFGDFIGWVLKDTLCSAVTDVYPQFEEGGRYPHDQSETVKLRAYINDVFGGTRGEFPLTSEEYVHYKLRTKKRTIAWGEERSRIAGTWQRKLKGKQGIYIRITPATDAVMEYVIDDLGYLAFVEAVYPDNSIKISEIVTEEGSLYRQQTLTSEVWKELRPVFITVA